MKTIIAGSRTVEDYETVLKAVKASGFQISEVVSGGANGVDKLGERYAEANGIPVKRFPARWNDFSEPCLVRSDKGGRKYNALAGHNRNGEMGRYADALIAIHNGSPGTRNMIEQAKALNLKIFEYIVK